MTDEEAIHMIESCGDDCWSEMWSDGLSPRDAVHEEISNWDTEE